MEKRSFNSVQIPDGSSIDLWVTYPDEKGSHPAILLLDEGFGVNAHIRSVAERLSMEGYTVFIPDVYHRLGRQLQFSYLDYSAVLACAATITMKNLSLDLKTTLSAMEAFPYVNPSRIGTLGFGHGARYAFIANSLFHLSAGVSFYGFDLERSLFLGGELGSPHLFFWPGRGADYPGRQAMVVDQYLRDKSKDFTSVTISYAETGFFCEGRSSYHPLAARQAWGHTLLFFDYLLQ